MPRQQAHTPLLPPEQPLISFIIPVWKVPEEMVAQCISSIMMLEMADKEREIILVHDGDGECPGEPVTETAQALRCTDNDPSSADSDSLSSDLSLHPSAQYHGKTQSDNLKTPSQTRTPFRKVFKHIDASGTTLRVLSDDTGQGHLRDSCPCHRGTVVCITQPHSGLSVARNTGIENARGRYLQFVDADDWLEPRNYNHIVDLARRGKGDLFLFRQKKRKENGNTAPSETLPATRTGTAKSRSAQAMSRSCHDLSPVSGAEWLCQHNMRASACGYLFHRDLLGSLRFHPQVLHEDEEFTPLLLLNARRLVETTAAAYNYRQRSGSIMHQRDAATTEKELCDTEQIIHDLNKCLAKEKGLRHEALQRRLCQLAMDHLYNVIRKTHSSRRLQKAMERLGHEQLFPLPRRHYTLTYRLLARLTATSPGRTLLLRIL